MPAVGSYPNPNERAGAGDHGWAFKVEAKPCVGLAVLAFSKSTKYEWGAATLLSISFEPYFACSSILCNHRTWGT